MTRGSASRAWRVIKAPGGRMPKPKHTSGVGICKCGHFGSAGATVVGLQEHHPRFDDGHGPCRRCECRQFTWVAYASRTAIAKAEGKEAA